MTATEAAAPAGRLALGDLARKAAGLLPGLILLAVVGYAGKLAQVGVKNLATANDWHLPDIEYVLWAIVFGLIITNTIGLHRVFAPGVATYEFWLKLGIVLLGARFLLGDVAKLGGVSLALVAIELVAAIGIVVLIGRWFGLGPKLISLLAIGSSICGVSAIIAGKGAIDADDEDASFAIAAILALGAFGLFAYPAIGHLLGMTAHEFGLWAGLAVDNTAEATAAGAIYGDEAGKIAVLAKSARNATIGFVVLGFAIYWAARGQATAIGNRAQFLWAKFPKFVLGFLAVSALATAGIIAKADAVSLGNLSRWAFLLTFAGVGLRTDLRALGRLGWRPFVVGAFAELAVTVVTLGLVLAASAWIGL
ncbi:putative sulfate exporter family transporter [Streptosporangiaceae bacterium NEAU-GS5]|nr:putative sulfate exporter family transporter [Streptosporangiaceae bacterium NEAU-GS5]